MIHLPNTAIEDIDRLKYYLQIALKLEHATIPPYLTTAYTIDKKETNPAKGEPDPSMGIIVHVAQEEMLHLTQAANLLNAIGGKPNLVKGDFVPPYPTYLPTGQDDFKVHIEKFSDEAIDTFLKIERPTFLKPEHEEFVQHIRKTVPIDGKHLDESILASKNPFVPVTKVGDDKYELNYDITLVPHHHLTDRRRDVSDRGDSFIPHVDAMDSEGNHIKLHYWSIGEFYRAIHLGFVELTQKMGMVALFSGDPQRQIPPEAYWGGGELTVITNLKTALAAIELVAGQGEGSHNRVYNDENEIAHYFQFDQIHRRQKYRIPDENGNNGDEPEHPQGEKFEVDMKAVWPIKCDAKVADYHGNPELEERALLFNGKYKRFLAKLNAAFNGKPELLDGGFQKEMHELGYDMWKLIRNPIPGTEEYAAPTFEMDRVKYPPSAHPSEAETALSHP